MISDGTLKMAREALAPAYHGTAWKDSWFSTTADFVPSPHWDHSGGLYHFDVAGFYSKVKV
jgi:hypothetical protein